MDRQKLGGWVGRQKGADKISLRHINAMGKIDGEICSEDLTGEPGEANLEIADRLIQAADDDASGIGGVQSYIVAAYSGEKQIARLSFKVEGESDDVEKDGLSSEPATKTGLLAQLMRHNEAITRALVMGQDCQMRSLSKALAQATAQNEHMQAKHFETVETVEQLLSMKEDREIKRAEQENRAAQIGEMLGTVKMLAPVIAKKVMSNMGDKSAANAVPMPDANAASIAALRDSLMSDPERMGRLFELLKEEEKAVLIEMMSPAGN